MRASAAPAASGSRPPAATAALTDEALLLDPAARAVEREVERGVGQHAVQGRREGRHVRHVGRGEHHIEQVGAAGERRGQRWADRQQTRERVGEFRPRAEQPEQPRPAGQRLKKRVEPCEAARRADVTQQRGKQAGQHRLEPRHRVGRAEGAVTARAPHGDARDHGVDLVRVVLCQPVAESRVGARHGGRHLVSEQPGVHARGGGNYIRHGGRERGSIGEAGQGRDIACRLRVRGQAVGLLVGAHLQPVLPAAQLGVRARQCRRIVRRDALGSRQRVQRGHGLRLTQCWIAAAVDELVRVGEELDLADSSRSSFEVEAGADRGGAVTAVAHSGGQRTNVGHGLKVEAAPPDERADAVEKPLAKRRIAGAGARPDESDTLPRQRLGFIIGLRSRHR